MKPSAPEILSLLENGMGPDLHWFPEDVSPGALAETLASMANTDGGLIFIGVAPRSGHVQGLREAEGAFDNVFQAALLTDPPLVLPLPEVQYVNGEQVMIVNVPAGLPHIYTVGGRYLGREGRHAAPIPAPALRRKLIERGVIQLEARVPVGASIADLDEKQIEAYVSGLNLPRGENPLHLLARRGCVLDEGGELRPTFAGLLLFGRFPQQWLPNAIVLATRFTGNAISDQFIKQEIAGTLPQQIRLADTFVRENLRTVARIVGLTRQETLEYPPEAVRELLVNAVAHRDYNVQGDSIHLQIFGNRLEVHSPGGLPGPVNLANLLEARFSRNPVIVQVLSDMGYIERLGYGLDRVVNVMREHSLAPPQFSETAGTFRVALSNAAHAAPPDPARLKRLDLNPRQKQALDFIAANERITNSDYKDLCPDVHAETLRRDLADLVKQGLIMQVGSKRGTYYILKD
jgi:ATP-dependent DNA helicase RecG